MTKKSEKEIVERLDRIEKMLSESRPRRRRTEGKQRPKWMPRFIDALGRLGQVLPALREVGQPKSNRTLYLYRASDPEFRSEWDDAIARYENARQQEATP